MFDLRKILTGGLILTASASLAACQTTSTSGTNAKIDAVMAKAAAQAHQKGNTQQSLAMLEQLYKRNSKDSDTVLRYAHALRQNGYHNRAALILEPFVRDEKLENADIAIEYAAIQAAMGNYMEAENAARKAVLLAPESGKAYHVLGIALDAQGFHEPAHVAFEKGLNYWEGDPSPILNNLGLNLAAQGFLDEAIETLRKALATAPNRKEIERNLRIVSALQYQPPVQGTRLIPKPPRKPEKNTKYSNAAEQKTIAAAPVIDVEKDQVKDETGKGKNASDEDKQDNSIDHE